MSSWGGGIILYRTYAIYQDNHKYNVIKGIIPDFGYDVKFAVVVDGKEQNEIPTTALGKNNKYYSVDVKCPSSKTEGLWDYNAWKLNLDYIESNSKCNLTFTSNLSEAEFEKYIESGIEYRRNTYRGKDITSYKKLAETDKMNLYNQIKNCTFDDIYVGDYILSDLTDQDNKKIKWLIADLNNYRYSGDTSLTQCHATIIPANRLATDRMNPTDTTGVVNVVTSGMPGYGKAAYLGSEMVNKTLPTILTNYILKDFSTHVIEYRNILSNAMDSNRSNQYGTDGGASSSWEWVSRKLDLMSEVNVYGSIIWSSSGFDIGIDNEQYAIFKLKPELKYTDGNGGKYWYWLKAVTASTYFAFVDGNGIARYDGASYADGGIRPRFLID